MSNLSVEAKVKGKFRVQKRNVETGEIYFDSGEFNNAILNNYFADCTGFFSYCYAGTDSVVSESDTSMTIIGTFASGPVVSDTFSVDDNGLLTFIISRTFTFSPGQLVGNMSCLGITSNNNFNGTSLKIKALIKDVNGNPTTIPATASDQIIITHKTEISMNQLQNLGSISVDGVDYDVKFYCTIKGTNKGSLMPPTIPIFSYNSTSLTVTPKVSGVFTPPSIPNLLADSNQTLSSYISLPTVNATFAAEPGLTSASAKFVFTLPANSNLTGDAPIKAVGLGPSSGGLCFLTYEFTPALPKNSSIAYTFTTKLTLSRA